MYRPDSLCDVCGAKWLERGVVINHHVVPSLLYKRFNIRRPKGNIINVCRLCHVQKIHQGKLAPTKIRTILSLQELYEEYFRLFSGDIPEKIIDVFRQFDYINFDFKKI